MKEHNDPPAAVNIRGAEVDARRRHGVRADGRVHRVREDAAPNAVPGLENERGDARRLELRGRREPGRARADDDDLASATGRRVMGWQAARLHWAAPI